jgi:hypothetical protein
LAVKYCSIDNIEFVALASCSSGEMSMFKKYIFKVSGFAIKEPKLMLMGFTAYFSVVLAVFLSMNGANLTSNPS